MMKKPLKIVFDASPLLVNKTGVAFYIERLISQLAERYPDDIELVGFYYNFLGRRSAAHFPQAKNIRYRPVHFIPSKIIYQLRRFGIEIPVELLSKERADFVLFGNFLGYPSIYKSAAAPVVHDLTYLDLPEYVAAKNQSDLERFVPKQIKRSKFVVTVSEASKSKISSSYSVGPDNILVTPIPPLPPQHYTSAEIEAELDKLGLKKPFILFLGTIEPRKNVTSLIKAYGQLPEDVQKTYTLVIAGRIGWNCDAEVKELARVKEQGLNIKHLGYIDDRARSILYQSTSLFVTASNYEGFGMPVLEAMSYGTPCAASNIDVFHEVAGNAATYFDQSDPADISEKINTLLADPAKLQAHGKAGLQQAARFKWSDVADNLYRKIRSALGVK